MLGGIPRLVHARWIDPSSPIREQYQMSGNVPIAPLYWSNLADPETYLDEMTGSMSSAGLTMQYCGQTVGQILQGSKHNNLTTARVSPDGFNPRLFTESSRPDDRSGSDHRKHLRPGKRYLQADDHTRSSNSHVEFVRALIRASARTVTQS